MNTEKTLRKEIAHILMFVLTSKDIPVATDQIIKAVEGIVPNIKDYEPGSLGLVAEEGFQDCRTEFLRKLGEKYDSKNN